MKAIRFHVDHHFHIGTSHYREGKPCQDHAMSRSVGHLACAIVADGCSTGGNTDVGARVLTMGTLQAIRDHSGASNGSLYSAPASIASRQQQMISSVRPILGLNRNDMLATCVYAYVTQQGGVIHVQGDGVAAIKYRDGSILMHRFDWALNAPFYPSYDAADEREYIANPRLHNGDEATAVMTHISVMKFASGMFGQKKTNEIPFAEGRNGYVLRISREDLAEIEYLAVFTDGVTQLGKPPLSDDMMDWRDAVAEFLSFKQSGGEFVKRRMNRGLKDIEKIGRVPIDDISYAVIHVKETEERED